MDEAKDDLPQGDVGEGDTSENSVTENTEVASEQLPEQEPLESPPPEQAHRVVVVLKRFWWVFTIIILIIAGIITYFVYENHRNTMYNSYIQAAKDALNNNNYRLAITDYNQALTYNNTPDMQAQLSNAKNLLTQHESYLAGVAAMTAANYQKAISDFQAVTNRDRADYSAAQREINQAQAAINQANNQKAASIVINDGQKLFNDIATLSGDSNTIANLENNITSNDAFGSQALNDDVATMSTDANAISNDVSAFQSEISTFNTDAQYVNDSKISGIIDKVNTAVSALENDYSDMSNITSDDLSSIQNQEVDGASAYYNTPVINQSSTTQWNSDITNSTNEFNMMTNALSQLKAHADFHAGLSGQA